MVIILTMVGTAIVCWIVNAILIWGFFRILSLVFLGK